MHAASGLWAIGCPFTLCYMAPEYLDKHIISHAKEFGCSKVEKIGNVIGAPNVIIVGEPKEYGNQRYEYLLREEHKIKFDLDALARVMESRSYTDALIFPGGFDLTATLHAVSKKDTMIHLDVNFEPTDWSALADLSITLETVIVSTSSKLFSSKKVNNGKEIVRLAKKARINSVLLKENRGGCRLFSMKSKGVISVGAQTRPVVHSVGVGDCFDAIFIAQRHLYPEMEALSYASFIAAEYASTFSPDVFKENTRRWLKVPGEKISMLGGTQLPWEDRRAHQIYIAAPDFDYINTDPLEELVQSLKYHNFSPRRPVREHGQITSVSTAEQRRSVFLKDMELLGKCSALVAVLLYDDPGTLIEIGVAVQRGIPTIVYDPYKKAKNLVLTELPQLISSNLDIVITAVFDEIAKRNKK
jgi:nucleoside 2-deoxyribosyltransferase